MIAQDLLATARRLAKATSSKPKQADLRRAISTAYYALFYALAADAANLLVGGKADALRSGWAQAYRALDHGAAKNACARIQAPGFPQPICALAEAFAFLQQQRHDADYDPLPRFTRADALEAIVLAETTMAGLKSCQTKDRRALAVMLLMKRRQ